MAAGRNVIEGEGVAARPVFSLLVGREDIQIHTTTRGKSSLSFQTGQGYGTDGEFFLKRREDTGGVAVLVELCGDEPADRTAGNQLK